MEHIKQVRASLLATVADVNITDEQKERAFQFAWDLGHANGEEEVVGYFADIIYVIVGNKN